MLETGSEGSSKECPPWPERVCFLLDLLLALANSESLVGRKSSCFEDFPINSRILKDEKYHEKPCILGFNAFDGDVVRRL